jgi:hypothetical protein
MIIEMRTYILKPGTLKTFLDIYNNDIRETHVSILGNQIGFFYTEFGELNKVVHLYGYANYEDREQRRANLVKNQDFLNYLEKVKDIIINMKNEIMLPAEFSKIK